MSPLIASLLLSCSTLSLAIALKPLIQTEHIFPWAKVDHFSGKSGHFAQRYFKCDQYWAGGDAPIILQICGEYTCTGIMKDRLFPLVLAERYGALVISLEHRFFGKSSPFATLSTSNMKYLTTDQALFDLAYFQTWYQKTIIGNEGVTANPWFIIGGSYPGALAAWYRIKFPHMSVGALASSAVVTPIESFPQFDQQVGRSAGPACKVALQKVTEEIEEGLSSDEGAVKAMFSSAELDADDFIYLVADAQAEAIQYGHRQRLCQPLLAAMAMNVSSLLPVFASFVADIFFKEMSNSPRDYNTKVMSLDSYDPMGAGRQWWWMKCNEVGWFQVSPSCDSIRSRRIDLGWHRDHCQKLFGANTPYPPDVEHGLIDYGGPAMSVSSLILTNGVEDPWQWAGASSFKSTANLHKSLVILINCTECAHCIDLHTPSTTDALELTNARASIIRQVDTVLTPRVQMTEATDIA